MCTGAIKCAQKRKRYIDDRKVSKALAYSCYMLSFGCFAMMNTSAVFAHSLFPPKEYRTGILSAETMDVGRYSFYNAVVYVAVVMGKLRWYLRLFKNE